MVAPYFPALLQRRHNAAFRPDEASLVWAGQVVSIFDNLSDGAMRLDGLMVDKPHLGIAERILARAELVRAVD